MVLLIDLPPEVFDLILGSNTHHAVNLLLNGSKAILGKLRNNKLSNIDLQSAKALNLPSVPKIITSFRSIRSLSIIRHNLTLLGKDTIAEVVKELS